MKSSYSEPQENCVDVNFGDEYVTVRDTKLSESPKLDFTPKEWDAFIAGVKDGEFDRPQKSPAQEAVEEA